MRSTVFRVLGSVILLIAAGALVRDIVDPDVPAGTPAAQEGFRIGMVIGVVVRTAVLGVIGAALLKSASTPPARERVVGELAQIVAANRPLIPASEPPGVAPYRSTSDADLIDAYHHIDREAHPERYAALLWVIAQRLAHAAGEEP